MIKKPEDLRRSTIVLLKPHFGWSGVPLNKVIDQWQQL
jgi:hypothetical protein